MAKRRTTTGRDIETVNAAVEVIEQNAVQARQALALRRQGKSVWDIAEELKISEGEVGRSLRFASDVVIKLLDTGNRAELLALEVMRLDELQVGHWAAAVSGDVRAAQIVLACIDKRSRLLGLDSTAGIDARRQTVIVAGGEEQYIAALRTIQEVANG